MNDPESFDSGYSQGWEDRKSEAIDKVCNELYKLSVIDESSVEVAEALQRVIKMLEGFQFRQ